MKKMMCVWALLLSSISMVDATQSNSVQVALNNDGTEAKIFSTAAGQNNGAPGQNVLITLGMYSCGGTGTISVLADGVVVATLTQSMGSQTLFLAGVKQITAKANIPPSSQQGCFGINWQIDIR